MKDKIVKHKDFGEGKIISLKDNLLCVEFFDKERIFVFPDCFEALLSTEDKEVNAYAKLMLYNKQLEENKKKSRISKTRIYPRQGNSLRWHSYKSPKAKSQPKSLYTRYKGENAFIWQCNSEMIESGEIKAESEITAYIEKGDIILCRNNNAFSHIGVVSENSSNNIKCHFIPILGEVKCKTYEEEISVCTQQERDKILNEIKSVCPYMVSIEGIGHLM